MGRLSGELKHFIHFVTDSTPPGCLGVVDTVEVDLLSGHRDLWYAMERFDESPGIYYESLGKADW